MHEAQLLTAMNDARRGGVTAVDALSLLLIEADRAADRALGNLAVGLLAEADPRLWKKLDLATRRTWRVSDWPAIALRRITHAEPSTLALVVASFHPDGFVREAAVARLGEMDEKVALSALALRSADWVPQVRVRARAALVRRASSVQSLLCIGPLAVLVATKAEGGWLYAQLEASTAALNEIELRQLLGAPDWRLRRVAYSIAVRDGRLERRALLRAAERDRDLVIRVQCAEAAIRSAVATGAIDDVRPLAVNGTAAVRAAAVVALARTGTVDIAVAALADGNPTVREVAQTAVRRTGVDPAEHYRALVRAANPADPGAVAGLGETGRSSDIDLVWPSLTHPGPRGRVEAVRALRRLGLVDVSVLASMLDDPSAAVTRQVATTLMERAGEIGGDRLAELLGTRQSAHVRTAAYRLLRARDVWSRLLTDLELYDDDADNLRLRARNDLSTWLHDEAATTYSIPTGDTADRLDALLRKAASSLDPGRERLLRFHLGLTERA